jgi:hypothetical protein
VVISQLKWEENIRSDSLLLNVTKELTNQSMGISGGELLKRPGLLWAVAPMKKGGRGGYESLVLSVCWKQIEQMGTWGNG